MSDITEIVNWLLHVLYHSGFPGVSKISSLKDRLTVLVMARRSESKHADNKKAGIGSKMQDLFFPGVII